MGDTPDAPVNQLYFDKVALRQRVALGLRWCIEDHGSISGEWVSSATKRIANSIDHWLRLSGSALADDSDFWRKKYEAEKATKQTMVTNHENRLAKLKKRHEAEVTKLRRRIDDSARKIGSLRKKVRNLSEV